MMENSKVNETASTIAQLDKSQQDTDQHIDKNERLREKYLKDDELRRKKEHKKRQKEQTKRDKEMAALNRSIENTSRFLTRFNMIFYPQGSMIVKPIVANGVIDLFDEAGIKLEAVKYTRRPKQIKGKDYRIDIIAINGEEIVVGEAHPIIKSGEVVDNFYKKLKIFKMVYPEYSDYKIHGFVAARDINKGASRRANNLGMSVVKIDDTELYFENTEDFKSRPIRQHIQNN